LFIPDNVHRLGQGQRTFQRSRVQRVYKVRRTLSWTQGNFWRAK